jgi:hypothetical protein
MRERLPELRKLTEQLKAVTKDRDQMMNNMIRLFCVAYPVVFQIQVRYDSDWGRDYIPDPVYYLVDEQKATEKARQERQRYPQSQYPVIESREPMTYDIASLFVLAGPPDETKKPR